MKVDYHIHLEEVLYSIGWLAKINESLQHYEPLKRRKHSMEWLVKTQERLQRRVNEVPFTMKWIDLYLEEACEKDKRSWYCRSFISFYEAKEYYETYVDISDSGLGRLQKEWLDQVR